ncbi:hypothetical protein [Nocardioides sp. AE5]|uniref:helix-turn-helix transcriptional regulator n=1 Tax=Nocardioides sp. AE5 TaxID=2962573 RepID=UPI002881BF04|nr:hypothetical protein [Nocardioides sp. AE5]MDT0203424.1 hypothetical protein [Nocardioides sp. AE5]
MVTDHLLHRERTQELLAAQPGLKVIWSGASLHEFVLWARTGRRAPDLLLADVPVDQGPAGAAERVGALIRSGIPVLVRIARASPSMAQPFLRAGASGVVDKHESEEGVVAAVWTALARHHRRLHALAEDDEPVIPRPRLSDQEGRALVLYASGMTLAAVADALGVQRDTAKKYLGRVKSKYGAVGRPVHSKLDLHRVARADGYLDQDLPPS